MTMNAEQLDKAMHLLASLVLDTGERWGDAATEVQRTDALAILSGRGPRRHWLGRSRGYSKTTDVAALLIVLLVMLAAGSECVAAAADADQARILVRRMRGLLVRTGTLLSNFEVTSRRVTYKRTGSFVEVVAADGSSAWGLLPSVVVLDEFPWWPETENALELYDALTTALPKVAGSRLIIMGTAGDPAGRAAQIRARALADPDNWRVSEPSGPPPWMSPDEVELERRSRLPSTFARLFLNSWVSGEDRLTSPEAVRACVGHTGVLEPRAGVRYAHSLDLGVVNDRTALTTAHRERRGDRDVIVVDRQRVWTPTKSNTVDTRDVEAACLDAVHTYGGRIIADPWETRHMARRLQSLGVRFDHFKFSTTSHGRLALVLYRLIHDGGLDLPDDDELISELCSVVLKEKHPGLFKIDTIGAGHDDRVISLGLVAQHLVTQWSGTARLSVPKGRLPSTTPTPAAAPATPAIVREGEKRPVDAMTRFAAARRDPGYSGPRRQL